MYLFDSYLFKTNLLLQDTQVQIDDLREQLLKSEESANLLRRQSNSGKNLLNPEETPPKTINSRLKAFLEL